MKKHVHRAYFAVPAAIRKPVMLIIGMTVLLIGIAMIVLPGPAILVIPFALVILGIEFVWARQLLKKVRNKTSRKKN
jgi:uncharacterized protein (TIGR02611 family)